MKNNPMVDIDYEEMALCAIVQKQNHSNWDESLFTEERRYMYSLMEACMKEYSSINEITASILHKKMEAELLQRIPKEERPFSVPSTYIDDIFKKAAEFYINEKLYTTLLPILKEKSNQRGYEVALGVAQRRVREGDFDILADMVEFERFCTATDFRGRTFVERFEEYINTEHSQVVRTGIATIDENTAILKGNIIVIGGDTGSMKTTSALWLIIQILITNPEYKAVFFEKEMPIEDIMVKLIAFFTGVSVTDIILDKTLGIDAMRPYLTDTEHRVVLDVLDRLKLVGPNEFDSVKDMLNFIEAEKADIWCLDYLTQLFTLGKHKDFNMAVMEGINELKKIVQMTGSTGIVLCQLKKGTVENRMLKIPQLDDLEWSGDVKKLANSVLMTFYPQRYLKNLTGIENNYFYLVSKKNRFGMDFSIPLIAYPEVNRFDIPTKLSARDWLEAHIRKMSQYE